MRITACLTLLAVSLCGCDTNIPDNQADFTLRVTPDAMTDTIPLQRCVLLVRVENLSAEGTAGPVALTASADDAIVQVEPAQIAPGELAEITVICADRAGDASDAPVTVPVAIRGTRGARVATATVPVTMTGHESDLVAPFAEEMRNLFIPWLEANAPELGITADTRWTGTIVTPHILVVTHYLFLSADWEMHIDWHVMIPPYDWTRIDLRRRYVETTPSRAFEISSRSAEPVEVQEITPPESLWR